MKIVQQVLTKIKKSKTVQIPQPTKTVYILPEQQHQIIDELW